MAYRYGWIANLSIVRRMSNFLLGMVTGALIIVLVTVLVILYIDWLD
jgi:hypothetical protein